jgi:putative hydrolase of HD superfamily
MFRICLATALAAALVWVAAAQTPEAVVQAQVEAYNARDVEAFLATYSDDAQLFEHPDKLIATGHNELRTRYAERFKEPNLHAEIVKRIVMGNIVVDHEKVARTFPEGPGTLEAIAIYQVEAGKIAKVWLIPGAKSLSASTK